MTPGIDLAFAALNAQALPRKGQLTTLHVSGVPGVWAGLDDSGNAHLLLPDKGDVPPDVPAGLSVELRPLLIDRSERAVLDLSCTTPALAEVFEQFSQALVDELSTGAAPATALTAILERWRRFLLISTGGPSTERLAGIVGELLVLLDLTRSSPRAVNWWTGPAGARHDFRHGPHALEVKTTLATTSTRITVNGVDQLLPPEHGTLHLHHVRLEQVPGGPLTAAGVIDDLLSLGAPVEALYRALDSSGLPPARINESTTTAFVIRGRTTLPVDDRLPRIVPASFVHGREPVGTDAITYQIDLAAHLPRALDDMQWAGVLDTLTTGHTGSTT